MSMGQQFRIDLNGRRVAASIRGLGHDRLGCAEETDTGANDKMAPSRGNKFHRFFLDATISQTFFPNRRLPGPSQFHTVAPV
jgi:hypothetical protein